MAKPLVYVEHRCRTCEAVASLLMVIAVAAGQLMRVSAMSCEERRMDGFWPPAEDQKGRGRWNFEYGVTGTDHHEEILAL